MTDCCQAHDGPHVHRCTIPRSADGTEHRGGCLITQKKTAAEVALDDRQQEPHHTSEATGEPAMKTTDTILPGRTDQCDRWCLVNHDHDDTLPTGERFHFGTVRTVPVEDNEPFRMRLFKVDGGTPAIEILSPHGDPYDLTIDAVWDLAQYASLLAEEAERSEAAR